jgi:uncharacterized DUF497 family protein
MNEQDLTHLFANVRDFGWSTKKREDNLRKHKIDFDDARLILNSHTYIRESNRHGENRYQVFGYLQDRQVTFACTFRGPLCWIISARRSSRAERRRYYNRLAGLPQPGQD